MIDTIDIIKSYLELFALCLSIIGAPLAILVYFKQKERERIDREYGTFNSLDDKYIEFLNLCLQNIDLGLYDMSDEIDKSLSKDQLIRKQIIFEILVCLFERAFLMYQDHNSTIRKRQWEGWNIYIQDWMANKSFRNIWNTHLNSQFDKEFVDHMQGIYEFHNFRKED